MEQSNNTIEKLRTEATRFRAAIVRRMNVGGIKGLPSFPAGACTVVSWLITKHLTALGYSNIRYLQGGSPLLKAESRHGWLVVDDVIIDITGDQFGYPPVIVERSSAFHASFDPVEAFDAAREVSSFRADSARLYQEMLEMILTEME